MAKKKSKYVRVPVAYTTYRLESKAKINSLGETKFGAKKIKVRFDLEDYGQWSATFWHEWLHAVTYENGYNLLTDNEAFVESTAQAIMRFFTDPQGRILLEGMLKHIKPK